MTTQLILFRLAIQSSYVANSEEPATEDTFDTIQFFASNGAAWRIKTYATDQDVHVWSLDGGELGDLVELAVSNTEANYGDVLEEGYIIDSETGLDGVREQLEARGLPPHLNETSVGAVFWTPAGLQLQVQEPARQLSAAPRAHKRSGVRRRRHPRLVA